MRKNISLILSVLAFIAIVTIILDYRLRPAAPSLADPVANFENHDAPDFSFTDINGRKGKLSDLKGKIVILHFWASWCAPCVREFPKLAEAAANHKNRIAVLALSSDESPVKLRHFIKQFSAETGKAENMHVIWDKDRVVTHDLYQTFAYPETIVIDAQGLMIRKIPGDADWTSREMTSYFETLAAPLAKEAVKP